MIYSIVSHKIKPQSFKKTVCHQNPAMMSWFLDSHLSATHNNELAHNIKPQGVENQSTMTDSRSQNKASRF